ncbi:MAG TPA: hypothetical protein DCO79_12530 [Spirochaeta sp.]|nr:hypothetical protein [Spirochaeta sp.]
MPESVPKYIAVDNAAQIFVSIYSKTETTMSRIAVNLKNPVDKQKLTAALENIIKRFPFYQVYLKKHFFDYIFKQTEDMPPVEEDTVWTNRHVDFDKNKFPFSVKAMGNTVAVELSHIMSDGFGTMSFLMSLLTEYFRLEGKSVSDSVFIKRPGEKVESEEWECAFRKKFKRKGPPLPMTKAAYIPSGIMIPVEKYYSTRIIMDLDTVREQARVHHVTLNVYLASIYSFAIQQIFLEEIAAGTAKKKLPIRLQIPVNMRKDYPTSCLRNFSYLYSPAFRVGEKPYSFEEIIEIISSEIRHERYSGSLEKQISRNLRAEYNVFFRLMPRVLKQVLFRVFYHLFARSQYSGVLTNLGDIRLPVELDAEIDSFDILPCNSPVPGRNTSLFSYKGRLEMNIGSSCDDLSLEEKIINKLRELSIECEVIYKRDDSQSS